MNKTPRMSGITHILGYAIHSGLRQKEPYALIR